MAAAAIQPPGFQYFLNPQQQAPHQQPIQQGGQNIAQQQPQQLYQALQQVPQPPNEIPEYIFNLRLSTLQSSHRATFSPTDNRAIHSFLATDPTFLTFSARFPVTVTQLRNRGFDLSTLRALLGYAQVGNATTFDGIPILPMLDQKLLSKIEREYRNIDFDENNEEVVNPGSVMATNSRLPSVVINNNHHFLGSGEQNIGVSSVSPNASGMNATVPRAPVAISNNQPQPAPLAGMFAAGNPVQAANGAAQIEVPAVRAAAPVGQQAAAQVRVPGLQAPQPVAQQYAVQEGAQNSLQQQANDQQADQQASQQQHQQAAPPAVQDVPQQQFNYQANQNTAQQQARQQQVPQAQNNHGLGQNFSQNHQQQDQEQQGQQAANLFQQGRPVGAQQNQNESQQQPIAQQDPHPGQQQAVQQVSQDVLQQRDPQPIRQGTQQHPTQQATYPALLVQQAQSPSRRPSYAASSLRQRADSSDDERSMDAQPIARPPASIHRHRSEAEAEAEAS